MRRAAIARALTIAILVSLAITGAIVWRCRDATVDPRAAKDARSANPPWSPPDLAARKRGSIAGTVTDDANRPVAGALVCARGWSSELGTEPFREPACAIADSRGAYTIERLLPARYAVTASARPYRPALYTRDRGILLADGARVTGIAIVLRGAGVELTGVIADVNGGPIARARVTAMAGREVRESAAVTIESDDQGRFALWVAPGRQQVTAEADGYVAGHEVTDAPGKVEILMVPGASIEGTVVDAATDAPIAGARVDISAADEYDRAEQVVTSDARGAFRFDRLRFDRFTIRARAAHLYGRSAGSLLVGLGQQINGVVVRMVPARRVTGTVVIAPGGKRCEEPYGSLRDDANARWIPLERTGDALVGDAVLPGTYTPHISCSGLLERATYDPITVGNADISGLVGEVAVGATLRGKVVTRAGVPIEGAGISCAESGGQIGRSARSRADGSYELAGLGDGVKVVSVLTDKAITDRADEFMLEIDGPRLFEHDFVLEDGGTISGTTVDPDGQPVADASVIMAAVDPDGQTSKTTHGQSSAAGVFTKTALSPGAYRVEAYRADAVGDAATPRTIAVRANQTTTVEVVVAPRRQTITGTVVDEKGEPVGDAWVVAVSERRFGRDTVAFTRWAGTGTRPVVSAPDGTFALTKLAAGSYVVRAYRTGGGEALAEHVSTGSTIKLQIRATASIAGTVTDRTGTIQELVVTVAGENFTRTERFFGTRGKYAIGELPKGRYRVLWEAEHGFKQLPEIALEEGESKTSVDVELEPLVTVTGRVVDLRARTPVPAITVIGHPAARDQATYSARREAISDAAGRFQLSRLPTGPLELQLKGHEPYPEASAVRSVDRTTGTVDVGDLPIVKSRATGDDAGDLGFELELSRETTIAKRERKVETIEPAGPAARSGLRAGDVIIRVDGIDVRGAGYDHWDAAVAAPPGTKLVLELARGATVSIVLARPAAPEPM